MDRQVKEIIRQSYNQNAIHRANKGIDEWKLRLVNEFIDQVSMKSLVDILDLGAGSGVYAEYFSQKGLSVTCIDLSKSMVELCKSRGLNAEVMDFYELRFENNSIEAIWSMNTLLHVPKDSIECVLLEVQRVLKAGGIFYFGMYGGKSFEGIYEEDFYSPKRYFSRYEDEEIKAIVSKYFDILEFEHVNIEDENYWFQSMTLMKNAGD